ncbi:hypothetical protein AB0P02_25935 [Streptomyces griseoluteus]|uniref:hypothetical protein n=1 Tax=Streptomyces griseoluteus TaxID=29306 RepID=UPI0034158270
MKYAEVGNGCQTSGPGRDVGDGAVTGISENHVKVHFRLEVDENGWPPTSVESLWAVDLGDKTVRLDNTP